MWPPVYVLCYLLQVCSPNEKVRCKRRREDNDDEVDEHPALQRRRTAAKNLQLQAERMIRRGEGILPTVKVGDNVLLKIPEFDRGRADPANMIVVVMAVDDGRIKVGTKHGVLDHQLERNAVELTKVKSVTIADVPDVLLSLREMVRKDSVGSGQGFRHCTCRSQNCRSKRCTCFKNSIICSSSCHPGRSCDNHD
jgi:hypothetical protein